ncbi:MAG: glycoside hydrolase family 125 protein [Aerococcaceae bacterium]|nr:glycoside hydrolase family 125 protein [Aerococcaceae bacterium]
MKLTLSPKVYEFIEEIVHKTQADNPKWGDVFKKCFLNTLETTIEMNADGTTFVLTGDIPAMWLRDSTAQVRPYLLLATMDQQIYEMIAGLVELQFRYIHHDPYANAFNQTANGKGHQTDHTKMTDWIWERKYEVDSLCYPIQLAYLLYKNTGQTTHLNETFVTGLRDILTVWQTEQRHEISPYQFVRDTDRVEDTLVNDGKGSPVAYTGMTWSGFRPSDDRCEYHYLIPSNMFAVVVLDYVAELATVISLPQDLVDLARQLRQDIQQGIEQYALMKNAAGETIYAYEVDGLGHQNLMDDGNVPSLLSIPYLGYCQKDDPIYLATRRTLFTPENPWYYEGKHARGIGSSHTWENYIWPIALAIEGLTATTKAEQADILDVLVNTDGGTLQMHESFDVNDPTRYTREWFSWANMMFCELLLSYYDREVKR